jgi:hypothetical protein
LAAVRPQRVEHSAGHTPNPKIEATQRTRQKRNVRIGDYDVAWLGDELTPRLAEPRRVRELTINIIRVACHARDILASPGDKVAFAFQLDDIHSAEPARQYLAAEVSPVLALGGHGIDVLTDRLAPRSELIPFNNDVALPYNRHDLKS